MRLHLFAIAAAAAVLSPVAQGQGVASAALGGRVISQSGAPVRDAQLVLTNAATGTIGLTRTTEQGQYRFENVPIGRYHLQARAIGWQPVRIVGIELHLGDRLRHDIVLSALVTSLDSMLITESVLHDAGAGGPAYFIPGEAVRRMPLRDRNFVGLLAMAPQATGSTLLSLGGQNPRFNAIQVDGGSSGDFFGVNITPGASSGAKVISLEALEEVRILVAPFDVRQGGFSGGLINAATRSGTNELRGSVFATHARPALVGADTAGAPIETFNILQYGARIGGPILRDRLHFFAVADIQAREAPFVGPVVTEPATGISAATADRATRAFRDLYGFDPGTADPPVVGQPNRNAFVKLSWQPSSAHLLELSHSNVTARIDAVTRNLKTTDRGWQLSNSGNIQSNHTVTTRLKVVSTKGRLSNELITSVGSVDDRIRSRLQVPLFLVQGDSLGTYLAGGSTKNGTAIQTSHSVMELTENLSWSHGSHLLTIGTQNQLLHVHDTFFLGSWGVWTFADVDALERRAPSRYEVALPLRPGGPVADFRALQLAGYLQDRWTPTSALTLTFGLRIDAPFLDHPPSNPRLATSEALGRINTSDFPSGNAQLAPRLGFAWTLDERNPTTIRGGVGTFTGHPLYVWLATAFANTGLDQALLICGEQHGVPAPTTDISNLPQRCTTSNAEGTAVSTVAAFKPDFKYQQAVKFVLGADRQIGTFRISLDALHSRSRNQAYLTDANLLERGVNAEGRMMYGSITALGAARTTRLDSTSFGPVYHIRNGSGDRFTALTVAAQKSWEGGLLQAGYSWSRTMDVMSLTGFNGPVILQNAPIDGTLANRALRRSPRDIPHNATASAVIPLRSRIAVALFARARSGTPYAWTVNGDANADSSRANDLLYVPRDAADISLTNTGDWAALDAFIESEPCLRSQRGGVMRRATCRNPAVASLDASLSKAFGRDVRRGIEIRADVFNLPNLISRDWGLVRETVATGETKPGPLMMSGWDASANRPRYRVATSGGQFVAPSREGVVTDASRWRAQVSMRIDF